MSSKDFMNVKFNISKFFSKKKKKYLSHDKK